MWSAIASLLRSRKFLVTAAAILFAAGLVAVGRLPLEEFVRSLTALVAVLTAAIAIEDHGHGVTPVVPPPLPPPPSPSPDLNSIGPNRG